MNANGAQGGNANCQHFIGGIKESQQHTRNGFKENQPQHHKTHGVTNPQLHGFEHPTKALKNAGKYFDITEKEGDMIAKHMFPLTVTPPKYKETFVIVLVDKFCSFNEVLDDFIHRKFCGAKDTRIKWFGASKGEKR